jgi:hypothetical protein
MLIRAEINKYKVRENEADLIQARNMISDLIGQSIDPQLNRSLEATKDYLTKLILMKNPLFSE